MFKPGRNHGKRTASRAVAPALVLLALCFLAPDLAHSCSCGTTTLAQRFRSADNVFTAVVIDEYIEPTDARNPVRSLFAITESFKGPPPFGTLVSQPDDNSCGIDIDVGVEYLFYAQDSGHIGLCSGIRAIDRVDVELQALRAYSSGANPDLSEPWYFSEQGGSCMLGTRFEIDASLLLLGSLRFMHRGPDADKQGTTELRIGVGVFDFKPEGEHNPLEIIFADRIYTAPWRTSRSDEQQLRDGSKRTVSYADAFIFSGAEMREILVEIGRAESFRVRFDSEGYGLHVDAEVGTANLGSGVSEFTRCVQAIGTW